MIQALALLFWGSFAFGETSSIYEELGRRLSLARNTEELMQAREHYERLRILRLSCRLEVKEEQVPLHCYAALDQGRRWVHARDSSKYKEQLHSLDRQCRKAARRFHLPPKETSLADVSPACRREILEGWEIQTYRAGAESRWSED